MVSKKLFSSAIEEWETPEEVFIPLSKEFGPFDLDPAADSRNTRAPKFYSIEENGLAKEWNGRIWLNPPYGRDIGHWMQKAGHEALTGRAAIVVALVPARVDTAWWHDWVQGKAEVRFLPRVEVLEQVDEGDIFKASKRVEINRLWETLDVMAGRGYTKCGEKYRQFVYALPGMAPIKVDLFTALPETWGWIFLIRTGSADFSHHVAKALNKAGYTSKDGAIHRGDLKLVDGKWQLEAVGQPIKTASEQDVFDLARIPFREPRQRV